MSSLIRLSFVCLAMLGTTCPAQESLVGHWSLDLPNQESGWLGVTREADGSHAVQLMWAVGAPRPLTDFRIDGDKLHFTRRAREPLAPKTDKPIDYQIVIQAMGDALACSIQSGEGPAVAFSGKRQPDLPAAPNLKEIAFEEPIQLFDGVSLSGWQLSRSNKINGWSAQNGLLTNTTPKTDFSAYGEYGNLITKALFDDFQLHIEYRLPPGGGNSGIYLRGMYEVQVTHRDSSMQSIGGPGAVYGRIEPSSNQGKPAGKWETYDITLVDRHVTVVHNGVTVVDNQPVVGCTGGAIQSDVTKPGPLLLQGDHTSVEYRNIWLHPRRK